MPDDSNRGPIFNNPNWTVTGDVHQSAGDMTVNKGSSSASDDVLAKVFAEMMSRVDQRPAEDQRILKPIVEDVQARATTIQQGDATEEMENAFEGRLRALLAMAPDIGEVFVTTFANPIAGLALTFKKIADRAKASTSAAGRG